MLWQTLQTSWIQKPDEVAVVYTYAILQSSQLAIEFSTLKESKKMIGLKDIGIAIFLTWKDG